MLANQIGYYSLILGLIFSIYLCVIAVKDFNNKEKPIASVCHGILVLVAADIVKGKTCSAYPACAPDVDMNGGTWIDIGFEKAIIDGNLVTAAAWPAHPEWLAKFHSMLK